MARLSRSRTAARASKHLADALPHIAADPDRYLAATLIGVLSFALFVPAVLGVAYVLREQRPLLALSGAALAMVGILSSVVIHGVQFVQLQMIDVAADRGQMLALLARAETGIGLKVIFAGFILGLLLGWLILSAALFATRIAPRAIPCSSSSRSWSTSSSPISGSFLGSSF